MEQHVSEMNWRVWKFRMSRTLKTEFERYGQTYDHHSSLLYGNGITHFSISLSAYFILTILSTSLVSNTQSSGTAIARDAPYQISEYR
ncbi:hypothetical protein VNO80_26855 [Phaseolus coccineus]|uniref:Uncharacterized protein n=1 Tax=Phaseolus coccineus TaxID=3886 RepID=A0AAN9LFS1_PHACN